jgi:short-subunit dehydrogenase
VPATAGHTLYGPSKALLIKFSEALAIEVVGTGVHVTTVCPGFTETEFHDVALTRDVVRRLPRWMWMQADEVARQGFDAVMAGRPIVVTGRVNRAIAFLTRHLPLGLVHRAAHRQTAGAASTQPPPGGAASAPRASPWSCPHDPG